MNITESQVTKIVITKHESLDPITAIFEDFGPAQGKFLIECWGESWSHYWGAMGPGSTVRQFFLSCSADYLACKCVKNTRVTDYDAISAKIDELVCSDDDLVENGDLMREHYGDDWRMDLPQTNSTEYLYFCRIVEAVKAALRQLATQQPQAKQMAC